MEQAQVFGVYLERLDTVQSGQGPKTAHSPLSCAEITHEWSYTSTPPTPSWLAPRQIDISKVKVKVKAIPLQAWTGPEGSRSLRLPDFKTIGI